MEIKSTNINKTNNYISFQMIEKKTTTYVDGNPVPGLGLAQKGIGSKLKNGITTLCLLDNWIYNDNTDINKQKNVCIARRIR